MGAKVMRIFQSAKEYNKGFVIVNQSKSLFLSLLRAALWGEKPDASAFAEADWKQIFRLADTQTVPLLVLDGMGMLPKVCMRMPLGGKMKRIAQMQQIENANRLHRQVIVKIDKALRAEDIQAVFMKGQTTALRYPHPLHRTPGDIDFVVSAEDFDKTMEVMEKIGKVDHSLVHEHHGMAWVDGVTVEPFSYQEEEWAAFLMDDIMRVGNFGRGEYVFSHRGWLDAWRNYRWVSRRCYRLGFVCPSEARWWMVSKITRFFWKKAKEG